MKETVFDKLRVVKEHAFKEFEDMDDRKFYAMCAKLSTWHYKKKRNTSTTISEDEAKLYEFFIENKYNPSTVYKWMLVAHSNEEIQQKIANGEISFRQAMRDTRQFKKLDKKDRKFMGLIKESIERYIIR